MNTTALNSVLNGKLNLRVYLYAKIVEDCSGISMGISIVSVVQGLIYVV